jgi:FAD:protein FMN transferase
MKIIFKKHIIFPFLIFNLLFLFSCMNHNYSYSAKNIMDTTATITIYHQNLKYLKEIENLAFFELERINKYYSPYGNDSLVYLLNKEKKINIEYFLDNNLDRDLFYELYYLINESIYYSIISNGSFDITVQPILDLYSYSFNELKRPPTEEEILENKKKVGYNLIILNETEIILLNNTKITLGAIAKGYAIDKAIDIIKENGINNALINIGGDIKAIGLKDGKEKWSIGLINPENTNQQISMFKISNKAVATSGNYQRYFDKTKKFHHIVNPKTGYSTQGITSVTIISNDTISADAIATSVYVMGLKDGINLINSLADVEGLIIDSEDNIHYSLNFPK